MQKIDDIITDLLKKHKGGRIFFDYLDDMIRKDSNIIDRLMDLTPEDKNIIVSGKFGLVFCNYFSNKFPKDDRKVIVVSGGLRKKKKIENLSYIDIKGLDFTFLDDSFYSGRTRDKIAEELKRQNANLSLTCVAYDGNKNKHDKVLSLYRYYDFYS